MAQGRREVLTWAEDLLRLDAPTWAAGRTMPRDEKYRPSRAGLDPELLERSALGTAGAEESSIPFIVRFVEDTPAPSAGANVAAPLVPYRSVLELRLGYALPGGDTLDGDGHKMRKQVGDDTEEICRVLTDRLNRNTATTGIQGVWHLSTTYDEQPAEERLVVSHRFMVAFDTDWS